MLKKNRSLFMLSLILTTVTTLGGCSGGGSSSDSADPVSFQLEDDSIDNGTFIYERNGTVVSKHSLLNNLSNFFITTAFAAVDKTITCTPPEPVSFDMEILGIPVAVNSSCASGLKSNLRAGMLKSMANKTIIVEYAGGSTQLGNYRKITFNSADSFFDTYGDVFGNDKNILCRRYFTFSSDGKVIEGLDEEATTAAAGVWIGGGTLDGVAIAAHADLSAVPGNYSYSGYDETDGGDLDSFTDAAEVVADCYDGEDPADSISTLAFRFKDGYLEMDSEGSDFNDDLADYESSPVKAKQLIDYNRWCVDDGTGTACDTTRLPGGEYEELPTICHEEDHNSNNCFPGSIDPWI